MSPINRIEWESARCDLCGCDGGDLVLTAGDRLLGLPGTFRVVRCPGCGLLRLNPRPTPASMQVYYPPQYEPFLPAIDDERSVFARWDRRYGMHKRIRAIERLRPGGRLLDVGCATGVFLAELQRTGRWQTLGLEPSESPAAYARRRFGLEVFAGRIEELPQGMGTFDVVTLWNVLEHLHNPVSSLRRVASLLSSEGWAVVTIPNLRSVEARLFGPAWIGWELPRHLYWFPAVLLPDIFKTAGLAIRDMRCLMSGHNTSGLSLRFWLGEHCSRARVASFLLHAYGSLPVRATLGPVWWLLGRLKRLTLLTIMAQRENTSPPKRE